MSKDIICCTQNAVFKHMARATKLGYQKSGSARIKLVLLIYFIPLKNQKPTILHNIVFLTSTSAFSSAAYALFLV